MNTFHTALTKVPYLYYNVLFLFFIGKYQYKCIYLVKLYIILFGKIDMFSIDVLYIDLHAIVYTHSDSGCHHGNLSIQWIMGWYHTSVQRQLKSQI